MMSEPTAPLTRTMYLPGCNPATLMEHSWTQRRNPARQFVSAHAMPDSICALSYPPNVCVHPAIGVVPPGELAGFSTPKVVLPMVGPKALSPAQYSVSPEA